MFNIAVFVSGRGSNLKAIIDSLTGDLKNITIKAVLSNKIDCTALETAKESGIDTFAVDREGKAGFTAYNELPSLFEILEVDLIVLAGFLKKIPDDLVDRFKNKIINIHPALLPSFGGKGMYGMNVHNAVFNSSAKVSGATVHFVDKIYDNGKIIAQKAVDITDVEDPKEIAQRVLEIEHKLLPFVIKKISEGKVHQKGDRIFIDK